MHGEEEHKIRWNGWKQCILASATASETAQVHRGRGLRVQVTMRPLVGGSRAPEGDQTAECNDVNDVTVLC